MNRRLSIVILVGCAALFVAGVLQLFRLRFEAGDIYPEYSSLRSDPLGTMALYESLERLPHVSVSRDFSDQDRLPVERGATYLHLAASWSDWLALSPELFGELDQFFARGGRLVVTFLPETHRRARPAGGVAAARTQKSQPQKNTPAGKRPPGPAKQSDEEGPALVPLQDRWGVEFSTAAISQERGKPASTSVTNQTGLGLPETLVWHSALVFTNLNPAWDTVYAREDRPVVIQRSFGPGAVVMATDSFFLSNEAMARDRHADLLAWVVGPARRIVFDEAHLGIVEDRGIAALMRQYRLHGLAAGLVLLAGLFIWKNAAPFAPPYSGEARPAPIAGREAAAGLVNLLRRHIAPRDVLRVCFEEWSKSLLHSGRHSIARVDKAQAVLEAETRRARADQDPVRAYQEICRALKGDTL